MNRSWELNLNLNISTACHVWGSVLDSDSALSSNASVHDKNSDYDTGTGCTKHMLF